MHNRCRVRQHTNSPRGRRRQLNSRQLTSPQRHTNNNSSIIISRRPTRHTQHSRHSRRTDPKFHTIYRNSNSFLRRAPTHFHPSAHQQRLRPRQRSPRYSSHRRQPSPQRRNHTSLSQHQHTQRHYTICPLSTTTSPAPNQRQGDPHHTTSPNHQAQPHRRKRRKLTNTKFPLSQLITQRLTQRPPRQTRLQQDTTPIPNSSTTTSQLRANILVPPLSGEPHAYEDRPTHSDTRTFGRQFSQCAPVTDGLLTATATPHAGGPLLPPR